MTPRLVSLTVRDFRSIRGSVTIPLDAPIVLLHGTNGAGKTSLLAALEFAATGDVPALKRLDPGYRRHLVHEGSREARVTLQVDGLERSDAYTVRLGQDGRPSPGQPLLDTDLAHMLSERCLLPQSTLARLLEIYQFPPADGESPLTLYVRDLLGLDTLDTLLAGLHDSRDIRRLRNLVPAYREAEQTMSAADAQVAAARTRRTTLNAEYQSQFSVLTFRCAELGIDVGPDSGPNTLDAVLRALEDTQLTVDLRKLQEVRSGLAEVAARFGQIGDIAAQRQLAAATVATDEATRRAEAWWRSTGRRLDDLLQGLRGVFPQLPSAREMGPMRAHSEAREHVSGELRRLDAQRENSIAARLARDEAESSLTTERERLALVQSQLLGLSPGLSQLARSLAELLPLIDSNSDVCPVCGRDFADEGAGPLHAHLSARIRDLTQQADRLESLTRLQTSVSRAIADLERRAAETTTRVLSDDAMLSLDERIAQLRQASVELDALSGSIDEGDLLVRSAQELRSSLARLASANELLEGARAQLDSIADQLAQPDADTADPIQRLNALRSVVDRRIAVVNERALARTAVGQIVDDLKRLRSNLVKERVEEESARREAANARAALANASRVNAVARELHRKAETARAATIRRVFDDSLNGLWRELFVRLAPGEPFIPQFDVPDQSGPVEARLHTIDRAGRRQGSPGAMLSAGNLNTAALTLFVALHLRMRPALPWLILDDPVQSMDEVHISQFAALLRSLARELGRQVVVAVHERPLFDYLKLELSPAYEGDRLIAAEVSRAPTANTSLVYEAIEFVPDTALAG